MMYLTTIYKQKLIYKIIPFSKKMSNKQNELPLISYRDNDYHKFISLKMDQARDIYIISLKSVQ